MLNVNDSLRKIRSNDQRTNTILMDLEAIQMQCDILINPCHTVIVVLPINIKAYGVLYISIKDVNTSEFM